MSDRARSAVLVGFGQWGRLLFDEIHRTKLFQIDAVVSPSIRERYSEVLDCGKYATLDEALLDRRFEVAFVAVPPQHSAPLVEKALASGLDVFAEKPVAQTVSEATRICLVATRESRVLHVDYTYRFHWAIEKLSEEANGNDPISGFGLVIGDRHPIQDAHAVLWLWGPHLCAIFADVFQAGSDSSRSALEGVTLQVSQKGLAVRLDLASTTGTAAFLDYNLESREKKRELLVSGRNKQGPVDLLEPPPSSRASALSKSVAAFARKIRDRRPPRVAYDSCDVACIEITEVLERANRELRM